MALIFWLRPDDPEWATWLERAAAHDSYHLPGYHALAERLGEGEARMLVCAIGDRFLALPLLLCPLAGGLQDATSVYGYPGPLVSHPPPPADLLARSAQALCQKLAAEGVVAVFSRLNPLLDQTPWLAGLGAVVAHGETVSLDLALDPARQRAGYRQNHRRDLQRLVADGFSCAPDPIFATLGAFIELYHSTMRRVEAPSRFLFPTSYFTGLREALGEGLELLACCHDGEVVAGALMLHCGGLSHYHLGGTSDRWWRAAPMKLVFDTAQALGHARGDRVLHLGGGVGAAQDSLFAFKAGFSNRRHVFQSWRWIVMPEAYAELCAERGLAPVPAEQGWFPLYRQP